jgi:hypothetical protein
MEKKFKLPKRAKAKWLRALRSGEYKQGVGNLEIFGYDSANIGTYKYYCLGVAKKEKLCRERKTTHLGKWNANAYVSTGFLPHSIQTTLSDMNDGGKTFKEIANWIKKHL